MADLLMPERPQPPKKTFAQDAVEYAVAAVQCRLDAEEDRGNAAEIQAQAVHYARLSRQSLEFMVATHFLGGSHG
jgi:hypothetical protein